MNRILGVGGKNDYLLTETLGYDCSWLLINSVYDSNSVRIGGGNTSCVGTQNRLRNSKHTPIC